MTDHPNLARTQAGWDAARRGDYSVGFDALTDDVVFENGPGAGPWHIARGKDDLSLLMLEFIGALHDFAQDGTCIYADNRVAISLVHETGHAPDGDPFDDLAVYVARLTADGSTDRMWTVDLDAEHCETFWSRHPGTPSKDSA